MSMLKMCHDYACSFRKKHGYSPPKIYLFKYQMDMLKEETQWERMHPCETPSPDSVYGMEIIVVEEKR